MLFMRIILFPFSIFYALGIGIRNLLYKTGIYQSIQFDFPIICIGNLSFGGTGKTPHIEYLINLLNSKYKVAVLSRGYRRKTKGYILSDNSSTVEQIGDEPFQIKNKFNNVAVAVCENRVLGVPNLLADEPETNVILMDDGFQHRAIKAGLNIILTDYSRLFYRDWIAPSGMLREFRIAYKRAQIIIVTKCPINITDEQRANIIKEISPIDGQNIYFSYQLYDELTALYQTEIKPNKETEVLLFAGIANIQSLEEHLKKNFKSVKSIHFADHKFYSEIVIDEILQKFNSINSSNKIIITTEKDAVKLRDSHIESLFKNVPIFYQPMKINLFEQDHSSFNTIILNYVNQSNN